MKHWTLENIIRNISNSRRFLQPQYLTPNDNVQMLSADEVERLTTAKYIEHLTSDLQPVEMQKLIESGHDEVNFFQKKLRRSNQHLDGTINIASDVDMGTV